MEKIDYAGRVVLEKKKLSEKMKDMKEVKTGQKVNITSRLGKGNVNIVTKEVSEINPYMNEKEKIKKEKRDKELDELNALRVKLDAEDAFITTKPFPQ